MNDILSVIQTIIAVVFWSALASVVALLIHWDGREEREAWKKFAAASKLRFHPGFFRNGTRIEGVYRGHHLRIAASEEGRIHGTRVKLRTSSPDPEQDSGSIWDTFVSPTPEDLLHLLTPHGLYNVDGGELDATAWGESLWYWQSGPLKDVDKMQRICNLLADLADRYLAVVSMGGTAVPPLQIICRQNSRLSSVAKQMLCDIAYRTQERLGLQAEHLICPRCLARCGAHRADLLNQFDVTYYGCRLCHQSREFIDCPKGVVAVLDASWADAQAQQDGSLRVNWLARRALFDFDRVEIVQATDEDVERFAVQVGNDTDSLRRPRYAEMGCALSPACGLSENTLRVLESTFGQVQQITV